jgi:ABC-type phosphate transport system substrate-binding protein
MKRRKQLFVLALFFILSFIGGISIFTSTAHAQSADLTFIVHASVSDNVISQKDLQQIFLGRKTTWSDKQKISIVLFDDENAYPLFLKKIGKTNSQYSQYWKQQVFTGKGKDPLKIGTMEELIEYVANTEGAIAFVTKPVKHEQIKSISITD